MAEPKVDQTKLPTGDYLIGAAILAVSFVVFGLIGGIVPGFPQWLASLLGAVVGVGAWFMYLRKRKS